MGIDQREVGPSLVRQKPHRRGPAFPPIVHRAEPLVLRRRLDDVERPGIGSLQGPAHGVVAVDGRRRLYASTLHRVGNRAERRMRFAAVRDSSRYGHDQRRGDERDGNDR